MRYHGRVFGGEIIWTEKLKAVIFDWAGTTVDYGCFAPVQAFSEAVKELRLKGIKIGSTTGYTDKMMTIVTKCAEENGYRPDVWFSPDSVELKGRPYPYMVFKNMQELEVTSVANVVKVGDTISDIKEGKNAGVLSIGVIEGSSELGLSEEEYEALSQEEKDSLCKKVRTSFLEAGADAVILNMSELNEYIREAEAR